MTHPLSEVSDYPICEGILLTPEFMAQTMIGVRVKPNGEIEHCKYHRHWRGGGWVADSSFVSSWMYVPLSRTVRPNTRQLNDRYSAGQHSIEGDTYYGSVQISRKMTAEDIRLLALRKYWNKYVELLCILAAHENQMAPSEYPFYVRDQAWYWIELLHQVHAVLLTKSILSAPKQYDSVN